MTFSLLLAMSRPPHIPIYLSDAVSSKICASSRSPSPFLHSFPGRRKEERSDSLPGGNISTDADSENCRRPSLFKMVSLGKLKRESMSDKISQEAEDEKEEEEAAVKSKDPLSGNICEETTNPVSRLWLYNDPEHLDIALLLGFSKIHRIPCVGLKNLNIQILSHWVQMPPHCAIRK